MTIHKRTPVLIGVGQVTDRWDGADIATAPSPVSLAIRAARAALADTGAADTVARGIDVVTVVRTNLDSVAGAKHPFGRHANPPAAVAAALGLNAPRTIYSHVGGDQPQALVNEFAEAIFNNQAQTVLLAGAEAIAAMKLALRKRLSLDWSGGDAQGMEDRGLGKRLLSDYELRNGLGFPVQTYPLFENALRKRLGLSRAEHRQRMSELWEGFSRVAANNPYAQFPVARSAAFLAEPSAENYEIADPYLKWHVAQDAVNQGAAVILTSVEKADQLGIPDHKRIYLHGYAQAADKMVSERRDISRSKAMSLVLDQALKAAGRSVGQITHFDLYSCFPCAVFLAAEALDLDWRTTVPTVTGGLPFFGGAGNNYSMHAIASMTERLREDRGSYGLVLANGGYLSKEAAGVYSAIPVENWNVHSSLAIQKAIDDETPAELLSENVEATIESFTVTYNKGKPQRGTIVGRVGDKRILARVRNGHRATLAALAQGDAIGQKIQIEHEGDTNFIVARDHIGAPVQVGFLHRRFEFVMVERRGHLLEVTLNRPESLNSLHSDAHFELHEIWDAFERDSDLWAAIITGAGDRAFSSGNDLKATAKGGDMSVPATGFGGLCSRFDREKPIIAAVNGIAMGGGMEIVLACDLAVADPSAKFALPEVKVGLFAGAGGVQRLTRQIGRKAAMDLILTGRHIVAEEASRLGIVNSVTTPGNSVAAAREIAQTIIAASPTAVRASKQALNRLEEIEDLKSALAANTQIFKWLFRTQDLKEGVTAFAQKRPPQWKNM